MTKSRILVVEDEAVVNMEIEERLEAMGYEVSGIASTGEKALKLSRELRPDLVLMDIRLDGDMDGITAAEQISKKLHLPVIFVTACSEDSILERAKCAEPYGYLLKPFDDRELKSAIDIALYKHRTEEELRRMNRLYDILSQVNQTVVRAISREELLATVCRLVVERGAMDMAWIGCRDARTSHIHPVASFGNHRDMLSKVKFSADSSPEGQGAPARAISEGRPFVCNNCGQSDCLYPKELAPVRFGFQSCASFPLRFQGEVFGALNICVKEPDFFREKEIKLLEEVAVDISFALDKIEGEAQREKAKQALAENEERHRLAMEATSDGLWDWDLVTGKVYYSPSYFRMLGYEPGELPAHADTWVDLVHPDDRPRALAANEACIQNKTPSFAVEFRMRSRDGSWRWILGRGKAVERDENGFALHMIGTHVDITERKLAEDALRHSTEELQLILDTVPAAIWFKDKANNFLRVNRAACEMMGLPATGLEGKNAGEVFPDWLAGKYYQDDLEVIRTRQPKMGVEEQAANAAGELHWVRTDKTPWFDAQGNLAGVLVFAVDITDRRRSEQEKDKLQQQLFQSRKMESVGRLAGGVAHDYNNMLGVIIGYTEMALDSVSRDNPLHANLQEILKAANRSADITRQLLAFARKQTISPVVLDLNETVEGMLKMLRRLIGENIDLAWLPGAESLPIKMDPSQLDQILANLCVNARDAIAGVGKVTIETGSVSFDEAYCAVHDGFIPGEFAMLAVSDDGCGMDKETLESIFEPFFTTKDVDKGTGLGLATAYGIVRQNDGFINVYSEPDHGTTLKIYLPCARVQAPEEETTQENREGPGGTGTVLIVEDEESILGLGKSVLEHQGYTVLTARNPAEALALVETYAAPIHLLLTDVVMPGMNGMELNEKLRVHNQQLKCIFMSGYTANVIAHHGVLNEGIDFLQKPFSVSTLSEKVKEVLER